MFPNQFSVGGMACYESQDGYSSHSIRLFPAGWFTVGYAHMPTLCLGPQHAVVSNQVGNAN